MVVKKTDTTPAKTQENKSVAKIELNDEVLRAIASGDDALKVVAELYGTPVQSVTDIEIGNGFRVQKDKERLVGVPFVILTTAEHDGSYAAGFWSAFGVTLDGSNAKFILTDGGTGIAEQIPQLREATSRAGGWQFPQGLRKSEYPTCPECSLPCPKKLTVHEPGCGKEIGDRRNVGTTYYFSLDG